MPHSACYCLIYFAWHAVRPGWDLLLVHFCSSESPVSTNPGFDFCGYFHWILHLHFLFLLISARSHLTYTTCMFLMAGSDPILSHPIRIQPLNSFFPISWLRCIACIPTTCLSCALSKSYICASGATYL